MIVGNAASIALILVNDPRISLSGSLPSSVISGPVALFGLPLAWFVARRLGWMLNLPRDAKVRMSLISSAGAAFLLPLFVSVAVAVPANWFNPNGNAGVITAFALAGWISALLTFLTVVLERTGEIIHSIPGDVPLRVSKTREIEPAETNVFILMVFMAGLMLLSVRKRSAAAMTLSLASAIVGGLLVLGWDGSAVLMTVAVAVAAAATVDYLRWSKRDFIGSLTKAVSVSVGAV